MMPEKTWDEDELADRLFDGYYESLFGYLYWLTDDRQRAADTAAQVLVAGVRDRHVRACDPRQRAWLYRIATDLALYGRFPRPASARLPWAGHQPRAPGADEATELVAWGQPNALERALAGLPAHERAPLLLYGRCGLAIDEISLALGLPAGRTRATLAAVREHFRELYEQIDMS